MIAAGSPGRTGRTSAATASSRSSRPIVYRPLADATIVRPTRHCLRGRRPRRADGLEAYLDWCARRCDCVRCNREQV